MTEKAKMGRPFGSKDSKPRTSYKKKADQIAKDLGLTLTPVEKVLAKEQIDLAQNIWSTGAIYKDIDKVFDKNYVISNYIYIIKEALARGYLDIARRATKDLADTLEGKGTIPTTGAVKVNVNFTNITPPKTIEVEKAQDIDKIDDTAEL